MVYGAPGVSGNWVDWRKHLNNMATNKMAGKEAIMHRLSIKEGEPDNPRGDHDLNPGTAPKPPLKPAAVLIGLVDHKEGMSVLLTRRTDHLQHHAGQISFPGGHLEEDDGHPDHHATSVNGAIRETEEETGLDRCHITVIGKLDTYITRTGFDVTPVVALVAPPFHLTPDPHEVAEVFEVPLNFLMNPANHQRCSHEFQGIERYFHAIPYKDYFIWGATAGMIINLFNTLKD